VHLDEVAFFRAWLVVNALGMLVKKVRKKFLK